MRRLILALGIVACAEAPPARSPPAESQSYPEAVELMCNVDARAGVDPEDVLDAEAKRSEYMVENVKNSDGIYLLTLFRVSDPKTQCDLLSEAVLHAKLAACPLLTTLRAVPGDTARN